MSLDKETYDAFIFLKGINIVETKILSQTFAYQLRGCAVTDRTISEMADDPGWSELYSTIALRLVLKGELESDGTYYKITKKGIRNLIASGRI